MNVIDDLQILLDDMSYLDDDFIAEASSRIESYEKSRYSCDSDAGQKRIVKSG